MSNSTIYTYGQPQGSQTNYCDYDVGPTHRNCIHHLEGETGPELVMKPKVNDFKTMLSKDETEKLCNRAIKCEAHINNEKPQVSSFKGNEKAFSNKKAQEIIKKSIDKYKEEQK